MQVCTVDQLPEDASCGGCRVVFPTTNKYKKWKVYTDPNRDIHNPICKFVDKYIQPVFYLVVLQQSLAAFIPLLAHHFRSIKNDEIGETRA